MREAFAHVDSWVFDLDDTLYPRSVGIHRRLKERVVLFIADHMKIDLVAAEAVHLDYYERYGATLQGLVELHGVAPRAFLDFIHDIDLSALVPDEELIAALRALPGRRVIFTNASRGHAAAALNAMGMADLFDAIGSIEDSDFVGKPHLSAFSGFFSTHGIDPRTSAMFDDRVGNLLVPHEQSMKTVLVAEPAIRDVDAFEAPDHVDAVISNLTAFLRDIMGRNERLR
ncbi:pyrimidine 5'-nucleotidase [Bradyrhizobium sp. dw_78]|uniref:pyrimidine 5'-nucleotidase n=1 Tax=Bradyrhizobium sp. dw_78 TaxID=2719793 RepID=UPI001BD4EB23|nr:pyrimidine 5'-nucleotidase [Bradyrhizobium sp. dw_78]